MPSVDFLSNYTDLAKIASASITDLELVKYARSKNDTLMISTGMSYESEIDEAVNHGNPDVIFHTNSTYPSPEEDLNLGYIKWLKNKYPNKIIGYSGHEFWPNHYMGSYCYGSFSYRATHNIRQNNVGLRPNDLSRTSWFNKDSKRNY